MGETIVVESHCVQQSELIQQLLFSTKSVKSKSTIKTNRENMEPRCIDYFCWVITCPVSSVFVSVCKGRRQACLWSAGFGVTKVPNSFRILFIVSTKGTDEVTIAFNDLKDLDSNSGMIYAFNISERWRSRHLLHLLSPPFVRSVKLPQ